MDQEQILGRIAAMVDDERKLRDSLSADKGDGTAQRAQLQNVERELDQCWDLLRQRRAKSEYGENPDEARVRPSSQVEGYES
ncbi:MULTISPECIES: DUF2630 family protein [Streptomyces]|uniref:DUF2630 family protein n=1 Tax=Streptomyces albus (strain ATCC 21838 / DSM 41398 / FERM P-419 / JCM 4703 / NBRC 107858) TaxID=1081613 RepID=A0A0B5EWG9_STRA4|nr:DUF2630 family protein [Streptomyces sp. SCSIO ZS0520]AJE87168.1 hypothetical protein SLNWT_6792 [Streptomyces albus]AOU81473.1 hypothetical protein SLNHY_6782 [Streptomyces albus]AYN37166.1 DUF2630 domain-containing protein [Streptomyces albus]